MPASSGWIHHRSSIHLHRWAVSILDCTFHRRFLSFDLNPSIPVEKRTQSLLDLRHIIPPRIASKAIEGIDEPDGRQTLNNQMKSQPKHSQQITNSQDDEKYSTAGDPIYHTISSDKSSKSLGRNCVSLENLRAFTVKNDLASYGNNLLQNYNVAGNGFYILPAFPPAGYPPYYKQQQQQQQYYYQPYIHQNYRMPFSGYGGYTNPHPGRGSNANSKQSLGNESDDYRKYRDVAL